MTDTVRPITAKAKLAVSRADLLAAMGYEEVRRVSNEAGPVVEVAQLPNHPKAGPIDALNNRVRSSWLGRWWRRNPMSSVVELGEPFLQDYASRHPAKLIAYGAGAGAILWLVKPWRLRSVATVATLLFKTTDITGLVMDAVKGREHDMPGE